MASILENVKRGLETAPASPQLGAQEQVQQLTRATTGKAVGSGTTPALSQQGQAQAAQQTQAQQRQMQLQQQEVSGQLGAAERQIEKEKVLQKQKISQSEIALKERGYQKLSEILDNFAQNKDKLSLDKKKAQVEQAGFLLRLNNEKYITKLQIEGKKARLQNELQFKESLTLAIFAEERELLQSNLGFQSLINAEQREFRSKLEYMSLEQSMELADIKAAGKNAAAKYQAIGSIISGTVGVGGALAGRMGTETTTASAAGTPGTGVPLQSAQNTGLDYPSLSTQQTSTQQSWGLDTGTDYSGPWRP